jgi:hypothetical protein
MPKSKPSGSQFVTNAELSVNSYPALTGCGIEGYVKNTLQSPIEPSVVALTCNRFPLARLPKPQASRTAIHEG